MNSIAWIQKWYFDQCDDVWEQEHGITVQTLDNPGWVVTVELVGTAMEGVTMEEVGQHTDINHTGTGGNQNWLNCKVEEGTFIGAGGPFALSDICDVFQRWVEANRPAA